MKGSVHVMSPVLHFNANIHVYTHYLTRPYAELQIAIFTNVELCVTFYLSGAGVQV